VSAPSSAALQHGSANVVQMACSAEVVQRKGRAGAKVVQVQRCASGGRASTHLLRRKPSRTPGRRTRPRTQWRPVLYRAAKQVRRGILEPWTSFPEGTL
jgi:hypothetical protein